MATVRILNWRRRNSPADFTSCTTPACLTTRYLYMFMFTRCCVYFVLPVCCARFTILLCCGSQLPANMSVTWNKKMRKTAGYCITGQERAGGSRYARIELSEKVCDSAGMAPLESNQRAELQPRLCKRGPLLTLGLTRRSPQGHAHSRDVSRRDLADQRGEGRPRELLEAARPKSHRGAPRAADGDPLPQLRHQIQVPVPVHPLQEHVGFINGRSQACIFLLVFIFAPTLLCPPPHLSPGSGVTPSRWTLRGSRAPSARDSWFCWRLRSHVRPHLLPTSSKRTTGLRDSSWQDKATPKWCVSSALTSPPRLNSVRHEPLEYLSSHSLTQSSSYRRSSFVCIFLVCVLVSLPGVNKLKL